MPWTLVVDPLATVTGGRIVDSCREENEEGIPVMWSEAPESRIQLEERDVANAVEVP